MVVDKASENQPLLIAEIAAVLARDSTRQWKVDPEPLRGGYSARDVYGHLRKLYRRTVEDYRTVAPWLEDDANHPAHHDFVTAPTAHPRVNGHLRRPSVALPGGPTTPVSANGQQQQQQGHRQGDGGGTKGTSDVGYHLVKLALLLVLLLLCLWANSDYEASRDLMNRAARRVARGY